MDCLRLFGWRGVGVGGVVDDGINGEFFSTGIEVVSPVEVHLQDFAVVGEVVTEPTLRLSARVLAELERRGVAVPSDG